MRVPAVCNSCGAIFASGIEATNSTNVSFTNCSAGPCPACGGMGHIPDGVYNFIGNTIELLSGPARTISELERLAQVLKKARKNNASLQEISEEIEAQVPELSSIKDILPKTRTELYAFIALIISTISIILSQGASNEGSHIEINNVINNIYQQAPVPTLPQEKTEPKVKKMKIGRNDPCPCGSGKKYKKCCLL